MLKVLTYFTRWTVPFSSFGVTKTEMSTGSYITPGLLSSLAHRAAFAGTSSLTTSPQKRSQLRQRNDDEEANHNYNPCIPVETTTLMTRMGRTRPRVTSSVPTAMSAYRAPHPSREDTAQCPELRPLLPSATSLSYTQPCLELSSFWHY